MPTAGQQSLLIPRFHPAYRLFLVSRVHSYANEKSKRQLYTFKLLNIIRSRDFAKLLILSILITKVKHLGQLHISVLYISIQTELAGMLQQPIRIRFPSGFSCRAEPASDKMTPLWSPRRRVWEALSHYVFNAVARAAQSHPGGVKLHFKPRCSPPGHLGEEQVMKGPPKQHLSLSLSFSGFLSLSLSWISRRWAVWTPTMRTAQRSQSRLSTVTQLPRWRKRSWMLCTKICHTPPDLELQTWTWVSESDNLLIIVAVSCIIFWQKINCITTCWNNVTVAKIHLTVAMLTQITENVWHQLLHCFRILPKPACSCNHSNTPTVTLNLFDRTTPGRLTPTACHLILSDAAQI